ncbi:MAG TPA: thioesterase domain-containing protein, partial [Bryobacteraceae bacterium]|nr:thioesterase domain-containing protein [Bryobacteraceae bacterium]
SVAATLVRRIREIQPSGAYHIAGRCASGVIALEAAAQLIEAGCEVPLLALIESPNPEPYRRTPRWKLKASIWRHRISKFTGMDVAAAARYAFGGVKKLVGSAGPEPAVDSTQCAILEYTPGTYPGRMAVVAGLDRPALPDLESDWKGVAMKGLEVYRVPGGHDSMFDEPHVADLGRRLNDLLESAKPAAAAPRGLTPTADIR